jgi:adenosylhomocysteinase
MDVVFSCQALAAEHLLRHRGELSPGVQPLPETIDADVAGLKLESMGLAIDELSDEQRAYLSSWTQLR